LHLNLGTRKLGRAVFPRVLADISRENDIFAPEGGEFKGWGGSGGKSRHRGDKKGILGGIRGSPGTGRTVFQIIWGKTAEKNL